MTKDVVVVDEKLDIEKLVEAIREIAGEHLDRAILFGSRVTVLLHFPAFNAEVPEGMVEIFHQLCRQQQITNDVNESLTQLSRDFGSLSIFARDSQGIDQLRDFTPCLESQLLSRGEVLWASPEFRQHPAFPVDEARHSAISYEITIATRFLDTARYEIALFAIQNRHPDEYGETCDGAHTVACKCLRAMMYAHDIGPSDNDKWCVSDLLAALIAVMPQAAQLLSCVESLPDRFAYNNGEFKATRQEARNAVAAAMRIHRFTRKTTIWDYLRSGAETRSAAKYMSEKSENE